MLPIVGSISLFAFLPTAVINPWRHGAVGRHGAYYGRG